MLFSNDFRSLILLLIQLTVLSCCKYIIQWFLSTFVQTLSSARAIIKTPASLSFKLVVLSKTNLCYVYMRSMPEEFISKKKSKPSISTEIGQGMWSYEPKYQFSFLTKGPLSAHLDNIIICDYICWYTKWQLWVFS